MNKNNLIGFVLIGVIMFGFTWYQSKQYEKQMEAQAQLDSIAFVEQMAEMAKESIKETENVAVKTMPAYKDSLLTEARLAEAQVYKLSNDKIEVEFTTRGAQPYSVKINDYMTYDSTALYLIKPEQSQIWAVLRRTDSVDRLHYSLCNTFFGRLCLSGDIYDLNGEQWQAVDEGIEFYCHAAPIIKDGMTTLNISTPDSYNNPEGYQLVIREHEGRSLAVYHRFASSSEPDLSFLEGKKILHEYGEIGCDFSAKAWIYE